MRLWHYKLIPYLPKSQLLAQWRELNSIYKKQDKHILINYIYEYDMGELYSYSIMILNEFMDRGYKIKSSDNYMNYFRNIIGSGRITITPFNRHHNEQYLIQCFYNLQEKYDRGQKDFSRAEYEKLENFIKGELKI